MLTFEYSKYDSQTSSLIAKSLCNCDHMTLKKAMTDGPISPE